MGGYTDTVVRIIVALFFSFIIDRVQRRYIVLPKHISSPRTATYIQAIHSLLTAGIFLAVGYFVLLELQINITPFFASAGVIGIIVGLGLRPIVEDFFTALFFFTQDTLRIGDFVMIGDSEGWIESIDFRTIKLRDGRGAFHIFPNREVKKIINYSRRSIEVVIDIPIKQSDNIDTLLQLYSSALRSLQQQEDIGKYVSEKSFISGVEDIKDNGVVVIRVVLIVHILYRGKVSRRYRYLVLKELEKKNISSA